MALPSGLAFAFAATAYNLVRLPKLLAATTVIKFKAREPPNYSMTPRLKSNFPTTMAMRLSSKPNARLLQQPDRKQCGKGWEYLHLAVDDHSRLAYSEILPDEKRASCLKLLFNALCFFKPHGVNVERMMTDNGASFRSHLYSKSLIRLKIKHKRTKPYTPRTNGKAERFVQTSLREWAYAKPYQHSEDRKADLEHFLTHYNHHRSHFGINGKTPISRLNGNNLLRHDS